MKATSELTPVSRQAVIVLIAIALGAAGVGLWSFAAERPITAGFWFDEIDPGASADLAERLGGPLTSEDIETIETVARDELRAAYATLCLPVSDSPGATYGVRVRQQFVGLIAGGSRSVPGLGGHGDISFTAIASSAVAFAPVDAPREAIIQAIGRGVGRTAAHEFAHQVVGGLDIHDPSDRSSYEYPDLRPEHFYGHLHWTIAAKPLEARLGHCR